MEQDDQTPPITSLLWWMTPEEAWARPQRLLQQTMAIGLPSHVAEAHQHWSSSEFSTALQQAPPGVFDARSWSYWHTILSINPIPPLPRRQLS